MPASDLVPPRRTGQSVPVNQGGRRAARGLSAVVVIVAACSSSSESTSARVPSSSPTSAQTTSVITAVTPSHCPNADGGSSNLCLGPLDSGEYTTTVFRPTLTYSVPTGWSNMEDLPGNFLLIPPGGDLAGVNPMTSDFIGVYSSIAAPVNCVEQPDPAVATTVQAFVDWLQHQSSLVVSKPRPVKIGGLTGTEVDVSISTGQVCSDPSIADAYALVLTGTGPSHLTHGVVPNYPLRLDLFDRNGTILAVELADAPNGGSQFDQWWTAAAEITKTFKFET